MTTDSPTGTDLVFAQASLRDRMDWARAIAAAGELVPKGFRNEDGSPNAAKVLLASEYASMLGEHPLVGLTSINVIEGKPTPSPALMGALIRKAGHKLRVRATGTVEGGDYSVTVTLIRADDPGEPFTSTWTPQRAQRAGLCKYIQDPKTGVWRVEARSKYGKPLPWENFTEDLCKRRAISEVGRDGAEDVLLGAHYTAEEIGAVVDEHGEVMREDLIEDAVLVESDQEPTIIKARGLANETEVVTRPDRESSATPDTRPRSSRTKAEPGAGRTDKVVNPPLDDQHAVADEWALRARNALTVTDARDLYRDAKHRHILDYPTTTGELLEDVLRARGEHLADEEAQAAAGEPADEEVPLDLPY